LKKNKWKMCENGIMTLQVSSRVVLIHPYKKKKLSSETHSSLLLEKILMVVEDLFFSASGGPLSSTAFRQITQTISFNAKSIFICTLKQYIGFSVSKHLPN